MSAEDGMEKRFAPFRSTLLGRITDEDVYAQMRLVEAPHKLILVHPVENGWMERADSENVLHRITHSKQVYAALNRNVVAVPRHEHVMVVADGQPLVYTVVDQVYGKNLDDAVFNPEEAPLVKARFETAVSRMMRWTEQEYRQRGKIIHGIGLCNFMWGVVHDERNPRLYYTFIDPTNTEDFGEIGEHGEYAEAFWITFYDDFIVPVENLELKLGERLGRARRSINRLLNSVPEDDVNSMRAHDLLDELHSTRGGRYRLDLPR